MSIKVMNLVWSSTLEGTYKRFALLALADRASDQGEITALGVPNLCRKTGIKRSKMFGLLRELEAEDQLIQRVEQWRENGSRKASKFWINIPLLLAMQRPGDDDRDQDEDINPFSVSAVQEPVHVVDGAPSTTWTGPVPHVDGQGVHDMDGARPARGPLSPSPSETTDPDPDGDQLSTKKNDTGFEAQAAQIMARLDLSKVDAQPKQKRQVKAKLARLLSAGFEFSTVSRHAEGKLGEAKTCTYFLRGLDAEHISTAVSSASRPASGYLPDWCGKCDRPEYRFREDAEGLPIKCPQCHPAAAEKP